MNSEVTLTLDEAVEEVLGLLTGVELTYQPELERYRAVTRQLNRALRLNALEKEWSYYSSTESLGLSVAGESELLLPSTVRPRIINDDAVRLVDEHGHAVRWAYFLPVDALHKYPMKRELRCAVTRSTLAFSRPFWEQEAGLDVQVPVMREPTMFRLPDQPEDPNDPLVTVDQAIRDQAVDFDFPDVVILRAAFQYAQTDPVMQPRVQMLEAQYKDLMYQLIERDTRHTDSPYQNEWSVPVEGSLHGSHVSHWHPHAQ